MGVIGLIPFLKKACSDVIQTIPNRFVDLRGKRVVLDGTLLTQRLHFAPTPHAHRHVLGWYRIIRELQASEVKAVCVFDGPQRSLAKQLEIERRRRIRRLTESRGVFESNRFRRLRRLNTLLHSWETLDPVTRDRTLDTLRHLAANAEEQPTLPTHAASDPEDIDVLLDRLQQVTYDHQDTYAGFDEADLSEIAFQSTGVPSNASQDSYAEPFPHATETFRSHDHEWLPDAESESSLASSGDDIVTGLASLYTRYRKSLPQLALLTSVTQPPTATLLINSEEESTELKEDYVMSKTQNQLTNEEGLFWDHLTDTGGEGPTPESIHTVITTLAQKSAAMSESYKRRTQLPNAQTYRESKAIIQAMGVPCIETDGPYEAEALASSIVLNGLADYVGSEDTDVLVYEAPMLRNVANRGTPLVSISGKSVREALTLSRPGYVDLALLLGTDFSRRIKNVGPARALKFIRDHGSIERVLETEVQYPPRIPIPAYLEQIVLARSVFDTLPPIPNPSTLMQGEYDEEKVMSVLREYGLHWAAEEDWDYQNALAGNFFADNPRSD